MAFIKMFKVMESNPVIEDGSLAAVAFVGKPITQVSRRNNE
jgi:hypothetical protein